MTCGFFIDGNKEELEESVEMREFPKKRMNEFNNEVFANNRIVDLEGDVLEIGF
ncbi:1075_t:CDS:2 [Cetraspora pellucida]|uniref:1075_t:CDS:1 n=1 Tax=Cetraspora pellucida TaxID=1433469 RepID=A0A9N9CV09_9GLOM|nr:1075_t:CDS:2 [Cetraspora pellucida]